MSSQASATIYLVFSLPHPATSLHQLYIVGPTSKRVPNATLACTWSPIQDFSAPASIAPLTCVKAATLLQLANGLDYATDLFSFMACFYIYVPKLKG